MVAMVDGTDASQINVNTDKKQSKLKRLSKILKDPERKSLFRIFVEVICISIVKRNFPPGFYMSRFLFKKFRTNIFDFYPYSFFERLNRFFNDDEARSVLENKLFTHFFYSRFSVQMPILLAFNHRKTFVVDNVVHEVADRDDFRKILGLLLSGLPENESVFIKKTWGSYGGDSVFRVNKSLLSENSTYFNDLYSRIISSDFIIQKQLRQHPIMDSVNPSCVNTVRIDTFIGGDGKAEVMSAYLRLGINGSHVDNISAGGLSVPVDIETGRLNKFGYLGSSENWTILPEEHPDTLTRFEDITIPFFDKVKVLVCRMALLVPELRLLGWDIAIGETGPVFIEGNTFYDMSGVDRNYGGYRKNPVFKKAIEEYKERKNNS